MARVGIYLGSRTDDVSNILNVLQTWVEMLSESNHDIELLGGKNVPEFTDAAVRWPVPKGQTKTPFGKIWDAYSHVSRYISDRNPDVVLQLWKYQTHAPGLTLAGRKTNTPTIIRFTGDVFQEYRGYELPASAGVFVLDNVVGRLPLRLAAKVVSLGPSLAESISSRGAKKSKVHIVPPPIPNEERFSPGEGVSRNLSGIDPDRPVALFVGRLTEQKGMDFLEQVINSTLSKTDFQFVLVGDGPYRERFQRRFSSKRVILPGYVPHEEISEYYRKATVYVHPSPFEGIPLVILEALQSDTPVIARDAGDIAFVVDEVVQNVEEMTKRLVDGEWSTTWKNRDYFTPGYQQDEITRLISEALDY